MDIAVLTNQTIKQASKAWRIGNFHTDSWSDFKTYFKFQINTLGKINCLDIKQAQ
jgi:hypothetical protein